MTLAGRRGAPLAGVGLGCRRIVIKRRILISGLNLIIDVGGRGRFAIVGGAGLNLAAEGQHDE